MFKCFGKYPERKRSISAPSFDEKLSDLKSLFLPLNIPGEWFVISPF